MIKQKGSEYVNIGIETANESQNADQGVSKKLADNYMLLCLLFLKIKRFGPTLQ